MSIHSTHKPRDIQDEAVFYFEDDDVPDVEESDQNQSADEVSYDDHDLEVEDMHKNTYHDFPAQWLVGFSRKAARNSNGTRSKSSPNPSGSSWIWAGEVCPSFRLKAHL